jgi:hypothetical protein
VTSRGTAYKIVHGSTPIKPYQWYHIATTYNGTNLSIYVNGTLDAYSASSESDAPSSIMIGRGGTTPLGTGITGFIDELLIFNRSLSENEIKALYNSSLYYAENNFTGLGNSSHTFAAHTVDTTGLRNSTQLSLLVYSSTPALTANYTKAGYGGAATRYRSNDTISINASATDLVPGDVAGAKISFITPSGLYNVTNASMTFSCNVTNGSAYAYSYTVPYGGENGTWTIRIYAYDIEARYAVLDYSVDLITGRTVQFTLQTAGTSGMVAMGTSAETAASSLSNTSTTHPSRFYASSSASGLLRALITTGLSPLTVEFARSGADMHTLALDQMLDGSSTLLAFTRGSAADVENRIAAVTDGSFFGWPSPTFGFGLGSDIIVKLLLSYSDVKFSGNLMLRQGAHNLIFSNSGTLSANETVVAVSAA